MRIKELSNKTGISPRMIRYYEEQGLLRPERTLSGYRNFSQQDLIVIQSIKSLQEAGLTLDAVRVLMPCIVSEPLRISPCPLIVATLQEQRNKIQQDFDKNSRALFLINKFLTENMKLSA